MIRPPPPPGVILIFNTCSHPTLFHFQSLHTHPHTHLLTPHTSLICQPHPHTEHIHLYPIHHPISLSPFQIPYLHGTHDIFLHGKCWNVGLKGLISHAIFCSRWGKGIPRILTCKEERQGEPLHYAEIDEDDSLAAFQGDVDDDVFLRKRKENDSGSKWKKKKLRLKKNVNSKSSLFLLRFSQTNNSSKNSQIMGY